MSWNPNAGKKISKVESDTQIKRYRNDNFGNTHSNYFSKKVFEEILANPDVEGITIIHGMSSDGSLAPVLRGTTVDNKFTGESYNDSLKCPPICPDPTPQ